ncbi:MAG: DUF309 domain-containing protein, partial [Bacteroidetes bacterium]|nr:DUF309 domain-containing protein [Bacteroidota bacterium]
MQTTTFQPFEDRSSRDIRNILSSSLAEAIEQKSPKCFEEIVNSLLTKHSEKHYTDYILTRSSAYQKALSLITSGPAIPLWQGLVLWDMKLFFEVHEVLEHAWYTAQGAEKRLLQAVIRAAGVYIKLEYGYIDQAKKISQKAIPVLEVEKKILTPYCDPSILIDSLK